MELTEGIEPSFPEYKTGTLPFMFSEQLGNTFDLPLKDPFTIVPPKIKKRVEPFDPTLPKLYTNL